MQALGQRHREVKLCPTNKPSPRATVSVRDYRRKLWQPARGTGDSFVAEVLANQPAPESAWRSQSEKYDMELFGLALSRVRARVAEHNWRAFELSVLEGRSVEETAETLGLHAGMIYVARCKITKMLRQEILRLQGPTDAGRPEPARDEHESLSRPR
jgi:DNA-directed RNA polymerase specialized sigma24 family protein